MYKNKRVLMEAIHKQKAEKLREQAIAEREDNRRAKNKAAKGKKEARRGGQTTTAVKSIALRSLSHPSPLERPGSSKEVKISSFNFLFVARDS